MQKSIPQNERTVKAWDASGELESNKEKNGNPAGRGTPGSLPPPGRSSCARTRSDWLAKEPCPEGKAPDFLYPPRPGTGGSGSSLRQAATANLQTACEYSRGELILPPGRPVRLLVSRPPGRSSCAGTRSDLLAKEPCPEGKAPDFLYPPRPGPGGSGSARLSGICETVERAGLLAEWASHVAAHLP